MWRIWYYFDMKMCRLTAVALALALLGGCGALPPPRVLTEAEAASPSPLVVGDAAPELALKTWVQGEPVSRFEPGTVYVLDFWASWCGPCLAAMPDLSRLQEKYAGKIVAIGVTGLDEYNTESEIRKTAAELKGSIRFRLAIDDAGAMTERYCVAVRDTAIPRSFVIDQQGRFAWYGHPMDLPPVLDAVLNGTWDMTLARQDHLMRDEAARKTRAIVREYIKAAQAKDVEGQLRAAEEVVQYPVCLLYTSDAADE